jgi:hypothetical protein
MKASAKESQAFSDAIDSVNNGMETIINFYNELEEDEPLIKFEDEVIEGISKVKEKYGADFVNQKINTLVKEMISWLPLNETQPKKVDNKKE